MRLALLAFLLLISACAPLPPPPVNGADGVAASGNRHAEEQRWVEETLAALTLSERVGQMLMPGTGGHYLSTESAEFEELASWVEEVGIGGISLSIGLPHSYAAKLNALQRRARVPLLVSSNMEAGPGERLAGAYSLPHLLTQGGGTRFPPVMAIGATDSDSLAYQLGRVTGVEARAVGVHLTFSPTLDVNSNPANPIINTRSFGEDPERVARLGTAYLRGARAAGLLTTAKHFPGHGDTETDSHITLPIIAANRARLDAVELAPFRVAVEAGVDAIMTAHIAVPGVEGPDAPPATLSPYFLTRVLREEMGFEGVIITDAMEMGAITTRYGDVEALLLAIEAGADILLKPLDVRRALDGIVGAVRSGRIPEARIAASVRRILVAKARAGLHQRRLVDLEAVEQRVGTGEHLGLAQLVAERSLTLVRDTHTLIPLPTDFGRILALSYSAPADLVAGRQLLRTLARAGVRVHGARVGDGTSDSEWRALHQRADSADLVLVGAYVSPIESAGTVGAGAGLVEFVRELGERNKRVVLISFGSPYLLSLFPSVDAYLVAWGGSEVSQAAAARALLGEVGVNGTLPISLPPLFEAGHGLRREAVAR